LLFKSLYSAFLKYQIFWKKILTKIL
jgi:hypothetical protein